MKNQPYGILKCFDYFSIYLNRFVKVFPIILVSSGTIFSIISCVTGLFKFYKIIVYKKKLLVQKNLVFWLLLSNFLFIIIRIPVPYLVILQTMKSLAISMEFQRFLQSQIPFRQFLLFNVFFKTFTSFAHQKMLGYFIRGHLIKPLIHQRFHLCPLALLTVQVIQLMGMLVGFTVLSFQVLRDVRGN